MNVWQELRDKNIVEAKVYFDGGNDDGGVNSITYVYKDGKNEEVGHNPGWEDGSENSSLEYNLVKAVYNNYDFLGEPNIDGVLTYDVESGKVDWDVNEEYEDEDEDEDDDDDDEDEDDE